MAAVVALLHSCPIFVPSALAQQEENPQALNLYADAANAQNNGAFDLAADQWKDFLVKYPKSPLADKAQHYLGVCLLQLKPPKYEDAAKAFAVIVAKIPQNKDFSLNEDAYLNLGWCRYSLAKQKKPEEAANWHQQAADTFAGMVKQYPQGKFADQALFFQGEALYALEKRDEALVPYTRLVAEHPKSSLRLSGLYALGVTHEELSQFAKAGEVYDLLLKEFSEDALATEVGMRKGETVLQSGLALEKEGKAAEARPLFDAAGKLFAAAVAAPDFKLADHALYRQAFTALKQEKFNEAGDLYAQLTKDFSKSTYVRDATMSAGRCYYRGEKFEQASQMLLALIALETANPPAAKEALAAEAAHWLCRIYLKQSPPEPKQAEELATKVIPQAGASEYLVELLVDQADAVYEQPQRKADSVALYLKIAADHAQHAAAPRALYNAAFAEMELQKYDEGLKHAEQFLAAYKSDALAPDVTFVAAECKLFLAKHAEAEALYRELVSGSSSHADAANWQVRLGLSLYLQKKYDDTIAQMSPLVGKLPQKAQQAEANFLVGASRFFQEKHADAVPALQAALAADPKWHKADETLLLLSQALHKQNQNAEAIAAVKRLLAEHAESKLKDQAHFRYAEFAYASGDYPTAAAESDRVVADSPASEFAPYAVNRKGWAQLKQQQWAEAAATFTSFVDKHAQHKLLPDVLLARGMCRRQAKDHKGAVDDLNRFLATNPENADDRASALYERGLAETALDDNTAAAASFEALLKEHPKWTAADGTLYNLGWTYRALDKADKAVETFARLAAEHSASQYAAESHFHVAESLYDKQQWAEAQKQYAQAKQKAGQNKQIGERAVYKLGWARYKAGEFEPALAEFGEQVKGFPQGDLLADGLFMQAECLFQLAKYEEALPAYQSAKDAAAKAPRVTDAVKTLILLHGGQSAGQLKKWDESLALLTSLLEQHKDSPSAADAHFAIGEAQKNLGKGKEALAAWEQAATISRGEVGARARFEIGEHEFAAKNYDEAIKNFQRVMFGYGGDEATAEVKPWQAKSGVEAGRCAEVQIEAAKGDARVKLITDAKRFFSYVVEKHASQTQLAEFAKTRLTALAKIQ
jgi:TolA-binding protein